MEYLNQDQQSYQLAWQYSPEEKEEIKREKFIKRIIDGSTKHGN